MTLKIDPNAPLIGQDGLEYEDFAAYLEGRPINCWRNGEISRIPYGSGWRAAVARTYRYYSRTSDFYSSERHAYPQNFGAFAAGSSPARAGASSPVQAQADPVYPKN